MHASVNKIIISWDDDLLPVQHHQANTLTNGQLLSIWHLGTKWNVIHNTKIFFQENAFGNVCKVAAISYTPHCVMVNFKFKLKSIASMLNICIKLPLVQNRSSISYTTHCVMVNFKIQIKRHQIYVEHLYQTFVGSKQIIVVLCTEYTSNCKSLVIAQSNFSKILRRDTLLHLPHK